MCQQQIIITISPGLFTPYVPVEITRQGRKNITSDGNERNTRQRLHTLQILMVGDNHARRPPREIHHNPVT